jgi:hypothetical protein
MKKIDVIEEFFKGYQFPKEPIKLDQATTIRNPTIFIASHLSYLRGKGARGFKQAYFDRLEKFYNLFKK